jgi:PAS domain S-box-containing protein
MRQTELQLEAELRDSRLLQELSAQLIHEQDVAALYEKIIDAAVAIMRSQFASMQMLYPERGKGGELLLLAFRGFNPQAAKFWQWVRADSESTCGVALRTGQRVIAADVEKCDFMAGTEDLATYLQTGIRAVQTTPLLSRDGKLVGMISTHWREPHQPSERDLRLLDILARQAADLIERRRSEEALRESEAKYRTLFESIDEGFCIIEVIFDQGDRAVDYRFLDVNPAFERQTGLIAAQGRTIRELAPSHEEHWFEVYGRIARTGEPARFELPAAELHRFYDVYAWRYGEPHERKVAVLFNDVGARKQAEAALRESEERFRALVNTAPVVLWMTDAEGQCTMLSRGWTELTGQAERDALGRGWTEPMHPDDRERVASMFLGANAKREPFSLDYRLRRAQGQYRWAVGAGRPRFGAGGEFLGFIGSVTDVHERKLAEQALREADRRKDEFIATLSHELRNPLAPLANSLELLALTGGAAQSAPVHDMMRRQVNHLVRLTDDLLEISRVTRGALELRRERVELAALVRNALETSDPLIRAGGRRLELALPAEPLWLDGDPVRLAQILANLLSNSAKYTAAGGRIELRARREGASALISVSDDGAGIEAQELPRVFDMFSRGKRSSGLGIGLALARRLAEMHGGTIAAASAGPGQGAEFSVRLPLAAQPSAAAGRPMAETPPLAHTHVLVVDDNRDAADSLGMVLKFLGADVELAHGGRDALAAFDARPPAIVLLDIGMPDMDGYEVARAIRARGAHVPLVALTGWGQEDDLRRAREAGFDHHMIKPPDIATLRSLLGSVR